MFNLQKARVLRSRLVNTERPHDAEACRAFQRSNEPDIEIEEIGPRCPIAHLPFVKEDTSRMRIERAMESDSLSKRIRLQRRRLLAILKRCCHLRPKWSVNVRLVNNVIARQFTSIRHQQRLVAELAAEPAQFDEEPRIAD